MVRSQYLLPADLPCIGNPESPINNSLDVTSSSYTISFTEYGDYQIKYIVADEDFSLDNIWNVSVTLTGTSYSEVPFATRLVGNYPNPFNPTTFISYELKELAYVKIDVFNSKGQLVKTLVNQSHVAGHLTAVWNGSDNYNQPVSSGLYMYKFMVNNQNVSMKKCILLK